MEAQSHNDAPAGGGAAAFLVDPSDAVTGGDGDTDADDGGDEALLKGVEDVGGN